MFTFLLKYPVIISIGMVAFMSGILSIAREAILVFRPTMTPQKSLFWACVRISFVLSALLAFYGAYERGEDLQTQLNQEKDRSIPKLSGEVEEIISGDSPEQKAANVFVLISLTNGGAPSIADGFSAEVDAGTLHLQEQPTWINAGYTLLGADKKVVAKFQEQDNIGTKVNTPIPQGGRVRGWLRYVFNGVASMQVRPGTGVRWTITFKDYLNREYKATPNWNALNEGHIPKMYPGARQPFNPEVFKKQSTGKTQH